MWWLPTAAFACFVFGFFLVWTKLSTKRVRQYIFVAHEMVKRRRVAWLWYLCHRSGAKVVGGGSTARIWWKRARWFPPNKGKAIRGTTLNTPPPPTVKHQTGLGGKYGLITRGLERGNFLLSGQWLRCKKLREASPADLVADVNTHQKPPVIVVG